VNRRRVLIATILALTAGVAAAQQQDQPSPQHGKVLFSRSADDPPTEPKPITQTAEQQEVTDAERSALSFTAYDLDLHLTPATAAIAVRAALTVRNDGAAPLTCLTLQISSSLHWDAISLHSSTTASLPFSAHAVLTDADHTGAMSEVVVALPQPLAPGASLSLTALYSGAIPPSAERLERIGTPDAQAIAADWDSIAPGTLSGLSSGTALRGFGNVLWIPTSTPPVFLADESLFRAIGSQRLRESFASIRLRLAVEYIGDPPDAAFFCGQRRALTAISDNADLPAAESPGVATTVFDAQTLGFRSPSLFLTDHPASQTGTPANPALISAVTDHYDALPSYASAAALVEPLLTDWLGPQPLTPLYLIDHPGQPFEDDALLLRPMRAAEAATLAPSLAHSLTHAWIHSDHAWIDEGLAQFMGLLWIERSTSRAAALAELQNAARSLALAEPEKPDTSDTHAGQSLISASDDIFYRNKAAAVWWMLRSIVGDDALKQALHSYRLDAKLDRDPASLQRTLEKTSHKDLRWFFDDWVYRDRGLPNLSIVNVAPSQLESRAGLPDGWLIAVEARNDGDAAAEVPVTVRSSDATETQRLRIAAHSSASTRIVFASRPEQVEVNDGSVPESKSSLHTRQIVLPAPRSAPGKVK
jgi:hypothetical protein